MLEFTIATLGNLFTWNEKRHVHRFPENGIPDERVVFQYILFQLFVKEAPVTKISATGTPYWLFANDAVDQFQQHHDHQQGQYFNYVF